MCGLVGAFSYDQVKEAIQKMESRGGRAWTITRLFLWSGPHSIEYHDGRLEESKSPMLGPEFFVGHSLAPTAQTFKPHPAQADNIYLWHNGMADPKFLPGEIWDTGWLCEDIRARAVKAMSRL